MLSVKKHVHIEAPLEDVFVYLKDPKSNVEWLPGMVQVTDISGEGVGASFRWVYKMASISLKGQSTVSEFVPNRRFVSRSKGGIESVWTWDFSSEAEGTTIDLVVDYTVPVPVLGKLAEAVVVRQNERELDTALANIKGRMEN